MSDYWKDFWTGFYNKYNKPVPYFKYIKPLYPKFTVYSPSVHPAPVPPPVPSVCPIADAVALDIKTRSELGLQKYKVNLARTDLSKREWMLHGYHEALDLALYLKRLIEMEDKET